MSRRSKLIYLWSLNAILASIAVALVSILISTDDSADRLQACFEQYPGSSGALIPVNESFASVDEAEDFICHDVAYPKHTPGWVIENISATRIAPRATIDRENGFASITLDYMRPLNDDADLRLEVSPFRIHPLLFGIVDHVEIMGSEAILIQGNEDNHYIMQWEADGFSFFLEARLVDGFELNDLYELLNSISE